MTMAAALALAGTVAISPVAVAADGVTTSLPARTTSVPPAGEVSGSGQAVVWRQKTAANTRAHGWLSLSGGTPQDLGALADTGEGVSVDAVSVQDSVVAVATSTNPNGDLADHVTLRHLDTGTQKTLAVAYDGSGAAGDERYRGQAGDGILVQQAYYDADSQYRVRLVLRTSAADRTLMSDDNQYGVLASDADGALVLRRAAASWLRRIVYVDFSTGDTVTVAEPDTDALPQGLEFTPTHVGVIDGATLTEWQRAAPSEGPATVTLPTDRARWISDDTLAWYEWSADGNELYAMARDGSTAPADLNGTFGDISVGDDGRMRAALYRPDVDAAVQTLTDGRVSKAAGDASTIPAGPARLDALALSGGTLYTADDSSRLTGVLLSSALTVGASGAAATTPSRVLAYSTGTVHQTLAGAGNRVLVKQGDAYQVYANGTLTGVPLQRTDASLDQVVDFDGNRFLLWDKTTAFNGTLLLYTVATGAAERVPEGSALYGGALYSSVKTSSSSWSIQRTDLATAAVSTVTTVDCLPGDLQVRGSWILLTTCGAAYQGLLLNAGTTTRTTVDASLRAPVLGMNVLYTFTKYAATGVTLNAQALGVTGSAAQPLFVLPERTDTASAERWAVDREAPWAAWMDGDGVTHLVWAGAPSRTSASAPIGFSPDGDGKADTWAPKWTYNRPVTWTLVLKSGTTSVRTLTGTASGGAIAPVWNGKTDAGTAAADGSFTWTLSVKDAVTGVPAADVSGKVTLRRTVPAASVTAPTLASNSSTSAVIPVSWTAKTAGVTSYDVGWKVATRSSTGVWTLGPLQTWRTSTISKSAVFGSSGSPVTPKPGLTYHFYVRAHDDAGQTGAWSAAAAGGIPVDDRSSALTYKGTWASKSVTSAWSKTERVSATPGAAVSFTADGTTLRVIATAAPNGGRFAVIVDGTTVGTVNTYAATTSYRKVVFTYTLGTKITTHKAQLKVLSGSTAARATVRLDAVMVTR
ncbi:fibronectin type III domain-containing protein [Streptomyces sp. P17]|uniref:fibronectin type III domain-containing protein n=1 Tax=Streptomyces sp. P17 TaxID=3074716 RepID=UPI0028F45805|nr:fibronectin type III domain-containing protein [Streptomyces sp. P17]MDT9699809.1 fibronectin type III domain-containing protein [Streptomyces sp. P17]